MQILFTVRTADGRTIRLTVRQWKHIAYRHPEITDIRELEEALQFPTVRRTDGEIVRYYRYDKDNQRYLLVTVKLLNHHGFIITAYRTRKTT